MSIVLVTGGSRGLGRAAVLALADRGVDTLFTYRTAAAEADQVAAEVARRGRRATSLPLDVGRSETFSAFVEAVTARLEGRRLDGLVNNAGSGSYALIGQLTAEQLDEQYAVHLKGPLLLTQALVPLLADGGAIVNITTGLTRYTYPGQTAYGSMKGALEVATKYLARELGPRGIRVNSVAPGGIETDFGGGVMKQPELQQAVIAATPMGRMGQPADIGELVASLLAPESRWATGQRIEATGGYGL